MSDYAPNDYSPKRLAIGSLGKMVSEASNSQTDLKLPQIRSGTKLERHSVDVGQSFDFDLRGPRSNSQNIRKKMLEYSMSIRDIAHNNGKSYYPGEQLTYDLPTTDNYNSKRYQTSWARNKSLKNTYIDQIFLNAKKPEKSTPGCKYKNNLDNYIYAAPVAQKWNREKRSSLLDDITRSESKKVGPSQYSPQASHKVLGVYLG